MRHLGVMGGVDAMAVRHMGVMAGLRVVTRIIVRGGFTVVVGGVVVVLGRGLMMILAVMGLGAHRILHDFAERGQLVRTP